MDTLPQRIEKIYRYLYGIGEVDSKEDFAQKMNVSKSYISDVFADRQRKLTNPFLERVADRFAKINKEYALTGLGSVEVSEEEPTRPHYSDLPAAAGFMSGTGATPTTNNFPYNPQFGNYDYSVDVFGDSMLPDIHSGDIAFCEILTDDSEIKTGKIYVVDTKEGAAIKVIAKKGKSTITLHSLNPDYQDYPVRKEDIVKIAKVVGIQRKY